MHYFFVGIGGSGMSALADLVRAGGNRVSGSDRARDRGDSPGKFETLEAAGITLHPQDGSGVTAGIDAVVVSSAIEESIPDIQAARRLNIPVMKRAEVLAALFNARRGVGIAGTSGKTTTTGMTGWVLHATGASPSIANGGIMPDFAGSKMSIIGNAVAGTGDIFVAEMDESDGTIALFHPVIAVLNNITLDHKPFAEIEPLFGDFIRRAREGAVINIDDPRAAQMAGIHHNTVTVGIDSAHAHMRATGIAHLPGGIRFDVRGLSCALRVPGRHNVLNALAALAAAEMAGVGLDRAVAALETFSGIRRRIEVLGTAGGITVIDDFAHNPDKIAATLATLSVYPGRMIVMFQPHGFGPMKMMRKELVAAFANGLRGGDVLVMPEIYFAGGTVNRDISSRDLIGDIAAAGRDARFCEDRFAAGVAILSEARMGDRVVVMGARDDTLSDFAAGILCDLRDGNAASVH